MIRSILNIFRPTSVASVMASFNRQIARLEAVSERNLVIAEKLDGRADDLYAEARRTRRNASEAVTESGRADDVAHRLRSFIGE